MVEVSEAGSSAEGAWESALAGASSWAGSSLEGSETAAL